MASKLSLAGEKFWETTELMEKLLPFLDPESSCLKTGTFAKSARFQVPKNGTSGAETKKQRPLFDANIPPKWCRTRLFCAFSTFGRVFNQFKKFGFLAPFDPLKMTKTTRVRTGA